MRHKTREQIYADIRACRVLVSAYAASVREYTAEALKAAQKEAAALDELRQHLHALEHFDDVYPADDTPEDVAAEAHYDEITKAAG